MSGGDALPATSVPGEGGQGYSHFFYDTLPVMTRESGSTIPEPSPARQGKHLAPR